VELKQSYGCFVAHLDEAFNRTIVELKPANAAQDAADAAPLIEPLWN